MRRLQIVIFILFFCLAFSCTVDINVLSTEISVKQGSTNIPHQTGYFNFGNIPLNFNQTIVFTIANTGLEPLKISGWRKVVITGQNKDDFIASTNLTASILNPNTETTFQIIFYPTSLGKKTAYVSIENNDTDRNPYTFMIIGTCTSPAPEIEVKVGDKNILCTTGVYDFGNAALNTATQYIVFTISNIGNKNLWLMGSHHKVTLSGSDPTMFEVNDLSTIPVIPPSNSTTFKIAFHPTSLGMKTAQVTILNNDSDENPFTFIITGSCSAASEINVKQDTVNIPCNSGRYIFNDVLVNESSPEITFTIENLGSTTLQIPDPTNNITITGRDASMFSVDATGTKESLPPNGSTTFKLVFEPTKPGTLIADVNIPNNDNDENPYVFEIRGTCIEPEINIKFDTVTIANGTGVHDFGNCVPGKTTVKHTFTIENLGIGDLKLTGTNKISISGSNQAMFTIDDTLTTTPIESGKSTTFTIEFDPTNNGTKTATISIANNDFDENPYEFTITGTGISYVPGLALGWIGGDSIGWKQSSGTGVSTNYNGFKSPNYVWVDSNDNIFVADSQNNRICKWDSSGNAIGWIGGGSDGWKQSSGSYNSSGFKYFSHPNAVCTDSAGNIYVADSYNHRICKWSSAGVALGWIGGGYPGWHNGSGANSSNNYRSFNTPSGLCLDSAGNIYVADTANHRISKWDSNGNALGWIGHGYDNWNANSSPYTTSSNYKCFNNPYDVQLDSTGNIYVADCSNYRISKWNSQGYAQGWIGGGMDGWQTSSGSMTNSSYRGFNLPRRLFISDSGYIYVADLYNHRVCKWDLAGNAIGWIGGGSNGWKVSNAPGGLNDYQSFNQPSGVFVTSDNIIYVADSYNNRICKWLD